MLTKGKDAPILSLDPLISAAWLYYHLELTQADIAKILGMSRTSVANLLAKAREEGIVTISLDPKHLSALNLAQKAKELFELDDLLVVPTTPDTCDMSIPQTLGKAGALYLERTIKPNKILAVGWGVTMLALAKALSGKTVPNLTVAQLLGGFATADSYNPATVASLIAEKFGARLYHLFLPAVVTSRQIRDILHSDPAIHSALEMAKAASSAVVGVGKVGQDATVVRAGFISPVQMDELAAKGAVGDIALRFFDLNGRLVSTSLDERLTSLTSEDLLRIRPVVAVAGGQDKIQAILGALRSNLIDVLITDEETMRTVLELATG
jgi:DNA-binding transcriptional regulator LsrR (DeoR family)